MLPAAWRKMWVSRVTGTRSDATSSANGLPAPTGASWSASPTSTTWVWSPTARSSVTSSSRLAIEVSSTISRSQLSGSCSSCVGPFARDPAQRRVDGAGAQPAGLGHPHRRPPGGRHQHHARAAPGRGGGDRLDRGGLAGARAAGDDRQPVGERGPQRRLLLVGQLARRVGVTSAAAAAAPRQSRARRAVDERVHARGQLGLELRRGAAGRPTPPRATRGRRPRARPDAPSAGSPPSSSAASASSVSAGRHVEPLRSASARACMTAARSRCGRGRAAAGGAGDPVGDGEADAEHAGQL